MDPTRDHPCGGGIFHDLFRVHRLLTKPEVGALLVCANRFTRKLRTATFRPTEGDHLSSRVFHVAPLSAAMDIINAADQDEALATLGYWSRGLP